MTEIDWTDKTWRSLKELAEMAFPPEAGVTAGSLQRRARRGLLVVYRPGKFYISNLANVWDMIQACKVKPKPKAPSVDWQVPRQPPPDPFGRTEAEVASARFKATMDARRAEYEKEKRKRAEERAVKMAERKQRTKERRRAKAREVYRQKKAKRVDAN